MKIQATEYGFKHHDGVFVSDIVSVFDSKDGLKIQIETVSEDGFPGVLAVLFDNVSGYRFLDEGDLYYYFSSVAFTKPYHIYKVLAGGWVNGEISQPDLLQVSKAMNIQEWFVATNNGCITVLSNCQPKIDWRRA